MKSKYAPALLILLLMVASHGCMNEETADDSAISSAHAASADVTESTAQVKEEGSSAPGSLQEDQPAEVDSSDPHMSPRDQGSFALFVACTKYDFLGESASLKGPANDVKLMISLLVNHFKFREENVTILATASFTVAGGCSSK